MFFAGWHSRAWAGALVFTFTNGAQCCSKHIQGPKFDPQLCQSEETKQMVPTNGIPTCKYLKLLPLPHHTKSNPKYVRELKLANS